MAITMANASSLIPLCLYGFSTHPRQLIICPWTRKKRSMPCLLRAGDAVWCRQKINSPLPHSLSGFLGHLASVLTPLLLHLHVVGYTVGVDLNAWENVQLAGGGLIHGTKCGVRPEPGTDTGTRAYCCS
jgi:hypothetical protein